MGSPVLYLLSLRGRRTLLLWLAAVLHGCANYQPPEIAPVEAQLTASQPLPMDAGLAELIIIAQQQHPLVQAALAAEESAKTSIIVAAGFEDPTLEITQGLNQSDWQVLGVRQEVPVFQRREMAIAQAKASYHAAKAQRVQQQADVALRVTSAFSEYLFAQKRLALQQELVQLNEQWLAEAEQRLINNTLTQRELLRIQNRLDEAHNEARNIAALCTSLQVRVNSELGRAPYAALPQGFDLLQTHAEFAPLTASLTTLAELALPQNPRVVAAQHDIQALQIAVDNANTAGLPRVMMGLEYMNTDMGRGVVSGMLGLSLPIWRSRYEAQQQQASYALTQGQAALAATYIELQTSLSLALYQWQEAAHNINLYQDVLLPRTNEILRAQQAGYRNGQVSFNEMLNTQQEWLALSVAYFRALSNQIIATANIHNLTLSYSLQEENAL